jgi:AAT family amino acid transporter
MSTQAGHIGLFMAIVICMNSMIGASIFSVPPTLLLNVGPAGLLTYALVTFAIFMLAQSFGYLAQRYTSEGAFYTYASAWGGPLAGLIASGSYLLGLTIALGLLTRITGIYLQAYASNIPFLALGIGTLWLLALLNILGARTSSRIQIILLALTILPLVLITLICFKYANPQLLTTFAPKGLTPVFGSISAVIFGYFGFESAPSLASLIDNPRRTLPRALALSVLFVGALYMIFFGSIALALPVSWVTSGDQPISQLLLKLSPSLSWLAALIHASIVISIAGTLHAMVWSVGSLIRSTAQRAFTLSLSQTACTILVTALRSGRNKCDDVQP